MEKERIFCGNARQTNENYTSISLCLTDIPKEHIFEYQGKKYIKLTLGKKETVDGYGRTHWLAIDTWKPESKSDSVQQKPSTPKQVEQPKTKQDVYDDEPSDELPF